MEKVFIITYDLFGLGRSADYQAIENELYEAGANRVLINVWEFRGRRFTNTAQIRDILLRHLRQNDRLLVVEAVEAAWYNI